MKYSVDVVNADCAQKDIIVKKMTKRVKIGYRAAKALWWSLNYHTPIRKRDSLEIHKVELGYGMIVCKECKKNV